MSEPVMWLPPEEALKQQFFFKVLEMRTVAKVCWGVNMSREAVLKYAGKVQKEGGYPEEYLEMFNECLPLET